MTVRLKLLVAFAVAALAVSLAGAASAKPKRGVPGPPAPEQSMQTPPPSFPEQIIPVKGVQPLPPAA